MVIVLFIQIELSVKVCHVVHLVDGPGLFNSNKQISKTGFVRDRHIKYITPRLLNTSFFGNTKNWIIPKLSICSTSGLPYFWLGLVQKELTCKPPCGSPISRIALDPPEVRKGATVPAASVFLWYSS
jgi:hypothetical protein